MESMNDSTIEMADATDVWQPGQPFSIILFYRYVFIEDVPLLLSQMHHLCTTLGLLGRLLIAKEGVNGTLAGSCSCIETFMMCMKKDRRFQHIDWKQTSSEPGQCHMSLPFLNLSIRESNEIVSSGKLRSYFEEMAPFDEHSFGGLANTGTHLKPHEFHAHLLALNHSTIAPCTIDGERDDMHHLSSHGTCPVDDSEGDAVAGDCHRGTCKGNKGGLVFDVRNQFEYDIGRFEHATSLNCATYAESWRSLDQLLHGQEKDTPVYMYCTGGIRCEKASVYVRAKGFANVYQLEGGIHRYLEAFPDGQGLVKDNGSDCSQDKGLFRGKNFVFDSRVAVSATTTTATPAAIVTTAAIVDDDNVKDGSSVSITDDDGDGAVVINDGISGNENVSSSSGNSNSSGSSSSNGAADTSAAAMPMMSEQERGRESEPGQGQQVVGRCLDCDSPFDQFSGTVVCTVCRLPVLVCPSCRIHRCLPGEYHCWRHRWLKHCYFTVLHRFDLPELRRQQQALGALEEHMKCHQGQSQGQAQGQSRGQAQEQSQGQCQEQGQSQEQAQMSGPVSTQKQERQQGQSTGPGSDLDITTPTPMGFPLSLPLSLSSPPLPPRPADRTMANKMRNRRATLRKQRLRVEERIAQLTNTNNNPNHNPHSITDATSKTDSNSNPTPNPNHDATNTPNTVLSIAIEVNSNNTEVIDMNHSSGINTAITTTIPATATTITTPATTKIVTPHHPHLVSLDDPLANPKTRLGWGFWQN